MRSPASCWSAGVNGGAGDGDGTAGANPAPVCLSIVIISGGGAGFTTGIVVGPDDSGVERPSVSTLIVEVEGLPQPANDTIINIDEASANILFIAHPPEYLSL